MFSEIKLEPVEVIEQWQTIEACGDTEHEVALRNDTHNTAVQGIFGGISTLTCKISQASRACRSLEVIVQAYWVQCFRNRVTELVINNAADGFKKSAISEACANFNFNWSEKELRNRMGIWCGYHDIRRVGHWAA